MFSLIVIVIVFYSYNRTIVFIQRSDAKMSLPSSMTAMNQSQAECAHCSVTHGIMQCAAYIYHKSCRCFITLDTSLKVEWKLKGSTRSDQTSLLACLNIFYSHKHHILSLFWQLAKWFVFPVQFFLFLFLFRKSCWFASPTWKCIIKK